MIRIGAGKIPLLLFLFFLVGCGGKKGLDDSDTVTVGDFQTDLVTEEAWAWADSVIDIMSVPELVGQLYMPAMYSTTDSYSISRLMEYVSDDKVGGIVLLKGDVASVRYIADTLRNNGSEAGVFLAIDAENGLAMRLDGAKSYPWFSELRMSTDQDMFELGKDLAAECREIGINMILGPVLDVVSPTVEKGNRTRRIMNRRSLGWDPHKVADLGVAYARGLEEGKVISVAKHFPGHGSVTEDSHNEMGYIAANAFQLDSIDLYPFRRYCSELLSGVMIGHLWARGLDSIERPAVVSPVVIQETLREKMNYGGLVITDALNMKGSRGVQGWEALMAGADLIIAPVDTRKDIEETLKALDSGKLHEEVLYNRVRRILFYKYLFGIRN